MLLGAAVLVGGFFIADPIGIRKAGLSETNDSVNLTVQPTTRKTNNRSDISAHVPNVFSQTEKLVADDGNEYAQLGTSVAISGNYAITGADRDDVYRGGAYIFAHTGTDWSQQQKLTGSDSVTGDSFGWSVAISGDTAVVGANLHDNSGEDKGAVYVFTRNGSIWSEQQKLTADDGAANDQFGVSVAISGDTLVVGAFGDGSFRGAAYVYTRIGSVWSQQQKLTATDGINDDEFGWSVGISNDSAVVGSHRDDGARGSAYVFTRNDTIWTLQQKLTAADRGAFDQFGYSVAISGETVITGSVLDELSGELRGSAYTFTRSGSVWSQQQKLTAADGSKNDKFGSSVAISGENAVIGANGSDIGMAADQGAAYLFSRVGTVWSELQKLTGSDSVESDNFGGSVAISGDRFIIGAYLDDNESIQDQGSAYIFTNPSGNPTPTPTPTVIPTTTPTPTMPTPTPTGLESDVSARPDGDSALLSNDVVQMRRFIVGLDVPSSSTNEFQRADIAPISSKGDGEINAADTAQARRYVVGLDPIQDAGGPTEAANVNKGLWSVFDDLYNHFDRREIRIETGNSSPGGRGTIEVEIDSDGNESAASFTLEFDAITLLNPRVSLGKEAPENSILTVNYDEVKDGRIGILIDSANSTAAGSARQFIVITFDVSVDAPRGGTPVRFTGTLASQAISDTLGNSLTANYIDGIVNISDVVPYEAELSGRVTTADGRGIRNVIVTVTNSIGTQRTATTGSFGSYRFEGLVPEQAYSIAVKSRRFRFTSRTINLSESLADVDFVALDEADVIK